MLPEFHSAPMLDFARPDAEAGMRQTLEQARSKFGTTYPLVIGGKRITTKETFQSKNPANASECVGNFSKATVEHVNDAVAAAEKAFQSWSRIPPEERADVLLRAAVVTGNSAILKPCSVSPLTAWKIFEVLEEAGVPAGSLNFLPGPGGTIGDALVEHPRVRFVAFTGSMEVGIGINEPAAKVPKGQIWLKRAILEMGGKDFMILDEDADLEAGVAGVHAAAFGFQGQKCSACSRAIVHEKLYDEFVEK